MRWQRALALLALSAAALPAAAADLKVFCPGAVHTVVAAIASQFTRATGHAVQLIDGTTSSLQKRVASGEAGDVVIATTSGIDALVKLGPVLDGTRAAIGKVGFGVAVRAGAPLPDISTPQSFAQTLLAAKSVLYVDPALGGQSGIHTAKVLEELGIARQIKDKTVLVSGAPEGLKRVASGEIEIGIGQMSELAAAVGLAVAGPFPAALQSSLSFSAGVMKTSIRRETARAFVDYLTRPATRARFAAAGFELLD